MKKYTIMIGNNDYCQEFDTIEHEGDFLEAEKAYEEGYRRNNAGQDDEIIDKLDKGELWFSARDEED